VELQAETDPEADLEVAQLVVEIVEEKE